MSIVRQVSRANVIPARTGSVHREIERRGRNDKHGLGTYMCVRNASSFQQVTAFIPPQAVGPRTVACQFLRYPELYTKNL